MISGVLAPSTNLISHPLSLSARDGGSWLDYPWMPLCTHSRYSCRVSRCGAAADAICSSSQPQRILSMVTMPTPMPFCGALSLVRLIHRTNTRHIRITRAFGILSAQLTFVSAHLTLLALVSLSASNLHRRSTDQPIEHTSAIASAGQTILVRSNGWRRLTSRRAGSLAGH